MRSFFILLVIVACTISCSFSVRAARSGSENAFGPNKNDMLLQAV
jgi:hypothetical protein